MQHIVKNTATARDRTLVFESFDTDGVKKDASGATLRIVGTSASAQNCDNAATQLDSAAAHSVVLTQAESDAFAIGEKGVLILPASGGFQEAAFPFLCVAENIALAPRSDAEIRTALGLDDDDLTARLQAIDDAVDTEIASLIENVGTANITLGTLSTAVADVPTNAELATALANTTLLQLIAQEVLKTLGMGRGNKVDIDPDTDELVTRGTDGTTEIARQPLRYRAEDAAAVGGVG